MTNTNIIWPDYILEEIKNYIAIGCCARAKKIIIKAV